jgi:hypothetical protein
MKLWLIAQDEKNVGYDDYDSAVVAAETEYAARCIHPSTISNARWVGTENGGRWLATRSDGSTYEAGHGWVSVRGVTATLIGIAKPGTVEGVICASFNAG